MSAAHEEIARRVAARLADEVGPKLPAYVEKVIALGEEPVEAPPQYAVDAAVAIALASFAVTAAKTAWDVYWKIDEEKRRKVEQAQALTASEVALVRELLAREIRAGVRLSDDIPAKLRVAAVETTIDETLEEAKRLARKQ